MCTITFSVSISTYYFLRRIRVFFLVFLFDYCILISSVSSTAATAPSSAGSLEACESVTSARAAASAAAASEAAAVGSSEAAAAVGSSEDVLQSSLALAAAPLACDLRLNGGGEGGFAGVSRLLRRNNTATSKCEI